jgi:hypothetical protein
MRGNRRRVGALLLAAGLLGCGGTIQGNNSPDGAMTIPCSAMGACECYRASERCAPRTEACWCPDVCGVPIDCICAGGKFLACENQPLPED